MRKSNKPTKPAKPMHQALKPTWAVWLLTAAILYPAGCVGDYRRVLVGRRSSAAIGLDTGAAMHTFYHGGAIRLMR